MYTTILTAVSAMLDSSQMLKYRQRQHGENGRQSNNYGVFWYYTQAFDKSTL